MTTQAETHTFQAETRELLDLMIHSLYSHKEIFLRELVSNASDALDKLRFAALTDGSLRGDGDELRIRLERDSDAHTLTIDDNGIGMTHDEVVDNIGTIARSGTRSFLEELKRKKKEGESVDAPEFIGQFGVGFYSCFMVSDEVVMETRKAGEEGGVRWHSHGDGEYTIEEIEKATPGTRITLHLRAKDDEDEEFQDFTEEWALRTVVKRYSDFVEYPIQMDVERTEKVGEGDDAEEQTVVKTEMLNSMKPLWTRARADITHEEYTEFYKHLSHDWTEPLETIHFKAEGTNEFTALLYVPRQRGMDILDPSGAKSRVSLYVKRIFVMEECEELMPPWLRFVRGLVDSSDLPLNVSRETLQHNRQIHQIRKRLVKKVIDGLAGRLDKDREHYVEFWRSLGPVVKEGLWMDDDNRDAIARLCLFESSQGSELSTLESYVERMPDDQEAIWYVTGPDRRTVEASPHIEGARAKGHEVLFLVDPIDEWAVQRLTTFDDKPLRSLDRGEASDESDADKESREEKQKELAPLLDAAKEHLDDYVQEVRLSSRLKESPAVLVADENAMSPQMEAMLRASGQDVPHSKRILELNPDHPVLDQLKTLHEGGDDDAFDDYLELLHGQALLAEGSALPDAAHFARLVTKLLTPESEGAA